MKKSVAKQHYFFINNAGYRQNEYLLILNPHEELRKKIMSAKEEFGKKFGVNVWGKPHLALARFKQLEMIEEKIISHLKIVAMGYHPIKIELKDFGRFSNPYNFH